MRDYPNLINASKRALLLDPDEWSLHYGLAVGYERTGKLQDAISEYQKAIEISGNSKAAVGLAHVYSTMGNNAEAKKLLRNLERKLSSSPDDSSYTLATIYAELGEKDKAFHYLNQALRERSFQFIWSLRADPAIDNLRSDSRFQALIHQVGLPSQ